MKLNKLYSIGQLVSAILMAWFSFHVANTWDIPVDNQIGMAFFGCFFLGIAILLILIEIKDFCKKIWS
jgi:RsiW-degrading membrane proteinase PrsW (M82 family)